MKRKHTEKKSANRSIKKEVFKSEMIGIARKHGQRIQPEKMPKFTRPREKRKKVERTNYPSY